MRYLVGAVLLYKLNPTFLLGTILNERETERQREREYCIIGKYYFHEPSKGRFKVFRHSEIESALIFLYFGL